MAVSLLLCHPAVFISVGTPNGDHQLSWVTWSSGWGLGRRRRSGASVSSPFVLYDEALSKPSVTVHSVLCQVDLSATAHTPSYLKTLLPLLSV